MSTHKFNEPLEQIFRDSWKENANALALLYAGAESLKQDYYTYGKMNYKSNLKDVRTFLKRYVVCNFYDGYNHDCLNLVQGKIKPEEVKKRRFLSPFKIYLVSAAMIFTIFKSGVDGYLKD